MLSVMGGHREEVMGQWIKANLQRVLQVCLGWGAGTLSLADIAEKVESFGLRVLCRLAVCPGEAGGSSKTSDQTPAEKRVALLELL